MSDLERIGGEEPTLDMQLAAVGVAARAAVDLSLTRAADVDVVHTLQDRAWESYRQNVLLPRAEIWESALALVRAQPYHHTDDYASRGHKDDMYTTGFYWRFGHHDTRHDLEVTTDLGLYVDESALTRESTHEQAELSYAHLCMRYEGIRKSPLRLTRQFKSILGVEPTEGMLSRRHLPYDELREAYSKEVTKHPFALSAQVYARPLGQQERVRLDGAKVAVQADDQEMDRIPILGHDAAKNIIRDRADLTVGEAQATIDQVLAPNYARRERIDPHFKKLAEVLHLIERSGSKPMSTDAPYDYYPTHK